MKEKIKKIPKLYKVIAAILASVLIVSAVSASILHVDTKALPDEDVAIKYSDYVATNTIENGTEFIGTYLINTKGMTQEIYDKALESQKTYGQNNFYYKNEMENGAWFDISSAAGIASLSGSEGVRVSDDELKDLLITCVVLADGTMKGAKTGEKMGLFDDPNPYDVGKLPEFTNLKKYSDDKYPKKTYASLSEKNSAKYIYEALYDFWQIDVTSDITKKADAQLAALQPVYDSLLADKKKDQADILSSLMKKIDNTRRAEVYYLLSEKDFHYELTNTDEEPKARVEVLQNTLNGDYYKYYVDDDLSEEPAYAEEGKKPVNVTGFPLKRYIQAQNDGVGPGFISQINMDGSSNSSDVEKAKEENSQGDSDKEGDDEDDDGGDKKEGNDDPSIQFIPDSDIKDMINQALSDCATAYNNYSGDVLSDPGTIIGTAEYDYSMAVIDAAESGSSVIPNLTLLQNIYSIKDNQIKDNDAELNIINGSLITKGDSNFAAAVAKGVSSEYLSAKAQSSSATGGADILDSEAAEIEAARGELEFLISAKNMRLAPKDALAYTYEEINRANALYSTVPSDDLKTSATKSIDEHIDWLKKEAERIKTLDDSLVSEMDKLQEQKKKLQDDQLDALYHDDMNLSGRIDAKIATIDDAITKEEVKQNAILNDPSSTAAEKAAAQAALGETGSKAASESDNDDIKNLAADDSAGTGGAGTGGAGAGGDAGSGDAGSGDAGSGDAGAGGDAGSGDAGAGGGSGKGGSGDGASNAGLKASESDLEDLLNSLLGKDFDELSAEDQVAVVVALDKMGEQGSNSARTLAKGYAGSLISNKNPFIYNTVYDAKEGLFVSLYTIGKPKVTDYRYGYDGTRHQGTMINRGKAICFTYNSNEVEVNKTQKETMQYKARFSDNVVYIPYAAAKGYFSIQARRLYVDNPHSVVITDKISKRSDEIYEGLING